MCLKKSLVIYVRGVYNPNHAIGKLASSQAQQAHANKIPGRSADTYSILTMRDAVILYTLIWVET